MMKDEEAGVGVGVGVDVNVNEEEKTNSAASPSPDTHAPPTAHDHDNPGAPQLQYQQPHHHNVARRLLKLIHPSGKIFHVVHSPPEVEKKRHEVLQENPKPGDFDVVIHGSDEHIGVVRDCHAHQTRSRNAIYSDNEDLLAQYEKVRLELDALSRELHDLTDHAVALDASFDKWGYSAKIRTTNDGDNSSLHSSNSDNGGGSDASLHDVSRHQDRTLHAMKFFKAAVIRQYFHKGLIWRSPQASEVVSFELFIDLVYVAVIDVIGEVAVRNASAASFLHYIIVFAISSKTFNDVITVMNWFEINDIVSRLCILLIVITLYAFASNTEYFFETTYTPGLAFYLTSRFFVACWFAVAAYMIPMVRATLAYHSSITILAAAFWIASIHVEYPSNLGLIFVAIAIDFLGSQFFLPIVRLVTMVTRNSPRLKSLFEYLPALNIEHRVDRMGSFVSLVIGYSVIKIFFQSHAEFPMNAFLGKGILGLIQAFIFNWVYFEIDAWQVHVHAIRRHWVSTGAWHLAHYPFAAGFILAASTLPEIVLAHDCSDANPEDLAESYAAQSLEELHQPLRWFYCGGLGVALISMAAISFCHVHKRLPDPKLSKRARLVYRILVAIVIILLPLDHGHHLTSLDLVALTTCLIASVLIVDIFGNTCAGDEFFRGALCKERKRRTQYTANCRLSNRRKKEIQQALRNGEKMDIAEVLRRDKTGSVSSLGSAETRFNDEDKGAGSY